MRLKYPILQTETTAEFQNLRGDTRQQAEALPWDKTVKLAQSPFRHSGENRNPGS
jgi:hypothetical protein